MLKSFRILVLFPVVALLFACQTTEGEVAANPAEIRGDCTRAESVPVDLTEFLNNPSVYSGRCVYGQAVYDFPAVFGDLRELYNPDVESAVVVYGANDEVDSVLGEGRVNIDFTAFAFTCAQLYQTGAEFISGPCHYVSGPVLFISEAVAIPNLPTRFFGAEAHVRYGSLRDVTAEWEYFPEVTDVSREFLAGVKARDVEHIVSAVRRTGTADGEWDDFFARSFAEYAIGDESPLTFLFGMTEDPQIRHFYVDIDSDASPEPPLYVSHTCVCRSGDCTGLWPIIPADTAWNIDWPYQCFSILRYEGDTVTIGW